MKSLAILISLAALLSGCASNLLVQNCYDIVQKNGQKTNGEVCKSTMPWTDFETESEQ